MSRSGYHDSCGGWALIRWRGAVNSAIKGERGQRLLRELLAALDAMPEKRLIAHELEADGEHCALGVLGKARGVDLKGLDPENSEAVAKTFDIAEALAREIVFINDDQYGYYGDRSEQDLQKDRWRSVRAWVVEQIVPAAETMK